MELPAQRFRSRGERQFGEAEPRVEWRIEGNVAEGRQRDAGESAAAGHAVNGLDWSPAEADSPVVWVDRQFGEMEEAVDRQRRGEADRAPVRPLRDEDVVAGPQCGEVLGRGGRRVGNRGMASRTKALGCALFLRDQCDIVRRPPRPDAIAAGQVAAIQPS